MQPFAQTHVFQQPSSVSCDDWPDYKAVFIDKAKLYQL